MNAKRALEAFFSASGSLLVSIFSISRRALFPELDPRQTHRSHHETNLEKHYIYIHILDWFQIIAASNDEAHALKYLKSWPSTKTMTLIPISRECVKHLTNPKKRKIWHCHGLMVFTLWEPYSESQVQPLQSHSHTLDCNDSEKTSWLRIQTKLI